MKTFSKEINLNEYDFTHEYLAKKQILMAKEIIDKTGYNIVTCGECGMVNIVNTFDEEHECMHCNYKAESCDFPDLIFDGMTVTRYIRANDADGNILNEGDKVVVLDGEGLDLPIPRGTMLYVNKIHDHESNFIEFDTAGTTHSFFGDRVLKLRD